jgi:hypothetical protein
MACGPLAAGSTATTGLRRPNPAIRGALHMASPGAPRTWHLPACPSPLRRPASGPRPTLVHPPETFSIGHFPCSASSCSAPPEGPRPRPSHPANAATPPRECVPAGQKVDLVVALHGPSRNEPPRTDHRREPTVAHHRRGPRQMEQTAHHCSSAAHAGLGQADRVAR